MTLFTFRAPIFIRIKARSIIKGNKEFNAVDRVVPVVSCVGTERQFEGQLSVRGILCADGQIKYLKIPLDLKIGESLVSARQDLGELPAEFDQMTVYSGEI